LGVNGAGADAVRLLLAQQRHQHREKRPRQDLGAFGGGVDAVSLNGAGDFDQVLVEHGNKGRVVPGGEVAIDLFELQDVVLPVVGGRVIPASRTLMWAFSSVVRT